MALIDRYRKVAEQYKDDPEYILEGLLIDINEQLVGEMERKKFTRTQLAKQLNCSNAYITKLLNGTENLTLKKLLEVALALGKELDIALKPRNADVQRFYHFSYRHINNEGFNTSVSLKDEYESNLPNAA